MSFSSPGCTSHWFLLKLPSRGLIAIDQFASILAALGDPSWPPLLTPHAHALPELGPSDLVGSTSRDYTLGGCRRRSDGASLLLDPVFRVLERCRRRSLRHEAAGPPYSASLHAPRCLGGCVLSVLAQSHRPPFPACAAPSPYLHASFLRKGL